MALGCALMVPGPSFAAGEQDKSATTDKATPAKPTATAHHKKPKKGFSDEAHENAYYDRPERRQPQGQIAPQRGQPQGQAR